MKKGRTPEYPEKTLGDGFQKMPHTKAHIHAKSTERKRGEE